uniref:RING-type domain-containing protein n=1 Tax=viral metagenome TaxID=1070528 RepID=A0A6C0BJQ8_9ZZZZ
MSTNTQYHHVPICRVRGCRYAWSHLTTAHVCGQCHQTGHGQAECGNQRAIAILATRSARDTLPYHLWCEIDGCHEPSTHTNEGHTIPDSHATHSSLSSPPRLRRRVFSPPHPFTSTSTGSIMVQGGVGIRPTFLPTTTPAAPSQVSPIEIECPLCRKISHFPSNQAHVVGVDNRCVVCWSHASKIYLPECGHVCLCEECCNRLNQNRPVVREPAVIQPIVWEGHSQPTTEFANHMFGATPGNIYILIATGMGCAWYARRREGDPSQVEFFFMHGDDWGQYGQETDRRGQLEEFLDGFQRVGRVAEVE